MSTNESLIDRLLQEKENRPGSNVVGTVRDWYSKNIGADLPLSNVGATDFHKKLRLEHSRSFDVGLDPRTREGQRLIGFLDSQGIPYLAFDRAIPGSSTGPHIHVGPPSKRGGTPVAEEESLVDRLLREKEQAAPETPFSQPFPTTPAQRRGAYGARAQAALKGRSDEKLVKLAHDINWHFGYSVLMAMPTLPEEKQREIVERSIQFAQEDEEKKSRGVQIVESPLWKYRNQDLVGVREGKEIQVRQPPEVAAEMEKQWKAYENPLMHLPNSIRLVAEAGISGAGGLMETAAGVGRIAEKLGAPGTKVTADFVAGQARKARGWAAESQDLSERTKATRIAQGVGSGLIEFAPAAVVPAAALETTLARIGALALTGGAYAGTQSVGRGSEKKTVARDTAVGAASFGLMGLPLPGKSLVMRQLSNLAIVGGGTTVINLATGQPLEDAAIHGLVQFGLNFPAAFRKVKVQEADGTERVATAKDFEKLGRWTTEELANASPEKLRLFEREQLATTESPVENKELKLGTRETSATESTPIRASVRESNAAMHKIYKESLAELNTEIKELTALKELTTEQAERLEILQERKPITERNLQETAPEPPNQRIERLATEFLKGEEGSLSLDRVQDLFQVLRGKKPTRKLPGDIDAAARLHNEISAQMFQIGEKILDAQKLGLSEESVKLLYTKHRAATARLHPIETYLKDNGYKINPIGEVAKIDENFPSTLRDQPLVEKIIRFIHGDQGSLDIDKLRAALTRSKDVQELGNVERKRNQRPAALNAADEYVQGLRDEQAHYDLLANELARKQPKSDVIDLTEQSVDVRSKLKEFLSSEEGSFKPEELKKRLRELLEKHPDLTDVELKALIRNEGVEMRHAGVDPREAVRLADDLNRAGVKIDRGETQDFSIRDWIRKSPLSNLDFKGYFEQIAGETGKKVSDTLRNTQINMEEVGIKWEHEISAITQFTEKARKAAGTPRKEFYEKFIELIEKPLGSAERRSTNPDLQKALEKHDTLTTAFKDYIVDSRKQLGIDMPTDWGITDRGYFRHLFLGDIQLFIEKGGKREFLTTARTYAEAQKEALKVLKADPSANIEARPRTNFYHDPTVRLSSKKFWATVGNLTRSVRGKGGWLTKADILEDVKGIVGQKQNQQKLFGSLLHREGYSGYLKDYARVMEIHAQQLVRTQELTKLNKELQPLIEQMKAEGKPGLAEDAQLLLDNLWGKPSKFEVAFGNEIRKVPILRNYVANPDMAFRSLATRLTEAQRILRLDFNARASIVNALDPWATLWPYTTTKEFVSLYADYLKPSTRQMLRDKGVSQGATKLEAGTPIRGTTRPRFKDVLDAEGVKEKVGTALRAIPRPFTAASEMNRGIGYLYGLKDGTKKGLEGDALHRYGLEWAKKVEFDNSMWNVAPILRSPGARVLGQFKGYPLKQIEHIGTLARKKEVPLTTSSATLESRSQPAKRLGKFVGAKAVIGGAKAALSPVRIVAGYFGYEIVSALSQQLQQNGMEKDNADKVAQAVYYGAPALMGQDLSSSVAVMDDLYGRTPAEKAVNLVGGPTIGTAFRVSQAKTWQQFAERVSPVGRLAHAPEVYESGGKLVVPGARGEEIELTPFESTMYMLGFTPLKQSQSYDEDTLQKKQYAGSDEKQLKDLAREFNKGKGVKQAIVISEGQYDDLTRSLATGGDKKLLNKLLLSKSKSDITDYYRNRITRPLTGSADREREFLQSLTPEQKQLYDSLKKQRQQDLVKVKALY